MGAKLRLVGSRDVALASIDSRSARLIRVLTSLACVPELPVDSDRSTGSAVLASSGAPSDSPSLVAEFDEAYTAFVDSLENLPNESQMVALQAVDTRLSAMLRAEDATMWTLRARLEDPSWVEVRRLAADVMNEFDWPLESPSELDSDEASSR